MSRVKIIKCSGNCWRREQWEQYEECVVNCMKIWVLKSKSFGRLLGLKWRIKRWLKCVLFSFLLCNTLLQIPLEHCKVWENHSHFFSPYVVTILKPKGHFCGMIHLRILHSRRIQTYTGFKILTPSCLSEGCRFQILSLPWCLQSQDVARSNQCITLS